MRPSAEPTRADLSGRPAIQRLEQAYFAARLDRRPQVEIDCIREAICLARGWEFKP